MIATGGEYPGWTPPQESDDLTDEELAEIERRLANGEACAKERDALDALATTLRLERDKWKGLAEVRKERADLLREAAVRDRERADRAEYQLAEAQRLIAGLSAELAKKPKGGFKSFFSGAVTGFVLRSAW